MLRSPRWVPAASRQRPSLDLCSREGPRLLKVGESWFWRPGEEKTILPLSCVKHRYAHSRSVVLKSHGWGQLGKSGWRRRQEVRSSNGRWKPRCSGGSHAQPAGRWGLACSSLWGCAGCCTVCSSTPGPRSSDARSTPALPPELTTKNASCGHRCPLGGGRNQPHLGTPGLDEVTLASARKMLIYITEFHSVGLF